VFWTDLLLVCFHRVFQLCCFQFCRTFVVYLLFSVGQRMVCIMSMTLLCCVVYCIHNVLLIFGFFLSCIYFRMHKDSILVQQYSRFGQTSVRYVRSLTVLILRFLRMNDRDLFAFGNVYYYLSNLLKLPRNFDTQ
jgi:hypothetical protein